MSDFVHLHTHTMFSPLDGVASPSDYFKVAAERKYTAIAITEHGNMASVPSNYFASKETGVTYIAGCEIYYNNHELERQRLAASGVTVFDDEQKDRYLRNRHLLILCKNMVGYRNLLKMRKESYELGLYKKPRIFFDLVEKYHERLIVGSGCMNGPISFEIMRYLLIKDSDRYPDNIKDGKKKEAIAKAMVVARQFKTLLKDDFYIELQMPGIEHDVELFSILAGIADALKIKCIITNDAHYIDESDYEVQRVMMAIDQDITVDDPNLFITKSTSGYFKTRDQLRQTFVESYNQSVSLAAFEVACDNTLEVANKCEGFKPDLSPKLPRIDDANDKLRMLVARGLLKHGMHKDDRYISQAGHELDRIIEKDFASYFLICRDLVNESIRMNMPVGPRGSAGGSLVCYLIGIHSIDPIKWSLSFDRFLSESRGGNMLQINMDQDESI